jgi:acyl carrier protein
MTEDEFLSIVCAVHKDKTDSALDVAIDDSSLDSLDLLNLRAELEKYVGRSLSDEKFVATSKLRDLFEQLSES